MADKAKETALVQFEQEAQDITEVEKRLTTATKDLLKQTVAKGATDTELAYFIHIAESRGLNPFARQIYFIKRRTKDKDGNWQSAPTIQTGIDGFRLIASRTNKYAPSPKPAQFEYRNGKLFRATVYGMKLLADKLVEFSATAKFSEYDAHNSMWQKMPETMLEKVAEAKLLRKGFPEELSGLYTADEMQQADVKVSGVVQEYPPEKESPEVSATDIPGDTEAGSMPESDNPMLNKCWIHDEVWTINKFGKRCHKSADGKWCNFNDVIKPMTKDVVEKALQTDATGFTTWLKDNYDGKTWSKFSEVEQLEILDVLAGKVRDGEKPEEKGIKDLGEEQTDA